MCIRDSNRIDEHVADYSKDYKKIKELALKEKQIEAIGKWTDETIKTTYITVSYTHLDVYKRQPKC